MGCVPSAGPHGVPAFLLLAAALVLSACGEDARRGDAPVGGRDTLLVRVAGMVQSRGVT
jgi:hypothetical protein